MMIDFDCTSVRGVRSWLDEVLAQDDSEFAELARVRLKAARIWAVVPQPIDASSVDPGQSLLQLGSSWVTDTAAYQTYVAEKLYRTATALEDGRISASMVGLKASDPFVQAESLFISNGHRVWASTGQPIPAADAARVLTMSEGYPPGVVVVHTGMPWAPSSMVLFAVSSFDCETFLWWV